MSEAQDKTQTKAEYDAQISKIRDYPEDTSTNLLNRILYFSAGVDKDLLKHCTAYDRVKAQGIGGMVIATAALAFLSGSYAFYVVFENVIASLIFGVVWCSVIYNLDRFIVGTSGPGDGRESWGLKELGQALPRLVLAFMIGFVISKPIEIRIMQSELDLEIGKRIDAEKQELRANVNERFKQTKAQAEEKIDILEKDIKSEEAKLDSFRLSRDEAINKLNVEMQNPGRPGEGPVAKRLLSIKEEKEREYAAEKQKLEPSITRIREALDATRKEKDQEVANYIRELEEADKDAEQLDGLMIRIDLAHEKYLVASWILTILFVLLEICPILVKMSLKTSPLDFLTENQKKIAIAMRGIELNHIDSSNPSGEGVEDIKTAVFHRAKLMDELVSGSLRTQVELAQQANALYLERTAGEVQTNLDRFIVKESKDS